MINGAKKLIIGEILLIISLGIAIIATLNGYVLPMGGLNISSYMYGCVAVVSTISVVFRMIGINVAGKESYSFRVIFIFPLLSTILGGWQCFLQELGTLPAALATSVGCAVELLLLILGIKGVSTFAQNSNNNDLYQISKITIIPIVVLSSFAIIFVIIAGVVETITANYSAYMGINCLTMFVSAVAELLFVKVLRKII